MNAAMKSGSKSNRLLDLLDTDGDRSIANLKRRYRLICKETHPDLSGRHEAFIQLNTEYRAALDILRNLSSIPATFESYVGKKPKVKTRSEARLGMLERLRTYAFKFYSRDSGTHLHAFIKAAAEYDPKRARLLCSYKAAFLDSYHSWLSDGRIYYSHAALISAVRQFFYYLDTGSARHMLLFSRFLQDTRTRASQLSPERRRIVDAFADWLEEEAEERL